MINTGIGDLDRMWMQQAELNRLFRPDGPSTFAERTALTKEIVLHLISECDELLRVSGSWQPHRNRDVMENRPAVAFELTDIQKYLVSLYLVWGITPDMAREYWIKKDMIVRQRHSEEFVKSIDRQSVLIDLDGVLTDYVQGFSSFLFNERAISSEAANAISRNQWIDQSTFASAISETEYGRLRHQFRIEGGFGKLPMLPGARSLLDYLHAEGYYIIILTSRPVHQYPNIYSDTLAWLDYYELHYDFIWWAQDKGSLVDDKNIRKFIQFAVDDDWKYVQQFANLGIHTYWINRDTTDKSGGPHITPVKSLSQILDDISEL